MARVQTIQGDVYINGNLAPTSFTPPSGSISDDAVANAAEVDATKLIHQDHLNYEQADGTNIASQSKDLTIVHGSVPATAIIDFEAAVTGTLPSGDYTVDVDLQRSTGGGAFATVLSAAIQFTSADTLRTKKAATISAVTLADGDILRVIVTVAGSSGGPGQGLIATAVIRQKAS